MAIFTPTSYFRRVNPDLLKAYFTNRGVLNNFPWTVTRTKPSQFVDDLVEAYLEIPNAQREPIEEELRQVHGLCHSGAQLTLRAICHRFKLLWDDEMMPEDRVLYVLMENKNAFQTAIEWCDLEGYQGFADYLGPRDCAPKPWKEIQNTFNNFFKHYFQSRACGHSQIDYYDDAERNGYLITYEAQLRNISRFDQNGKLMVKPERPTLESLMIYYPKLGKLKIKTRKQNMAEFICSTFAKVVLDQPDFFNLGPAKPVYDFARFKKRRSLMPSSFDLDPMDGIESVKVTTLYLRPDDLTKDTIAVHSIKDIAERIRLLNIDLSMAIINRVQLQVRFVGTDRGRTKSVSISLPNKNNLGDSKRDQIIEKCLKDWGIVSP